MYHINLVLKCKRVDSVDDYPIEDVDERDIDINVNLATYNYLKTLQVDKIMDSWDFEYRWDSYKDCNNYIIVEAIDIISISFLGLTEKKFTYNNDHTINIPLIN